MSSVGFRSRLAFIVLAVLISVAPRGIRAVEISTDTPVLPPAVAITRLAVGLDGQLPNGDSGVASMTPDGRFIAFRSDASNLVRDDTNGLTDIFVHDRATGRTTRENVSSAGVQANGSWSRVFGGSLSADGRFLVFSSDATTLAPGVGSPNWIRHVYLRDRTLGITRLVDHTPAGGVDAAESDGSAISADGRFVTFVSHSKKLIAGDTSCKSFYVRDMWTDAIERVSVETGNGDDTCEYGYHAPQLSADGRYVAFEFFAGRDRSGQKQVAVFVRDRVGGVTTVESIDVDGTPIAAGLSSLASDGRQLLFMTGPGGTFLRDRTIGRTTRLTPDGGDRFVGLSSDARYFSYYVRPGNSLSAIDGETRTENFIAFEVSSFVDVTAGVLAFTSKVAQIPVPTDYFDDLYLATLNAPGVPGVPGNLSYSVSGSRVTLTWSAPTAGGPATGYIIGAGSQPGRTDDAILPAGSSATSFTAALNASGTFYARVYATNASGTSAPSSETGLTLGNGIRPPSQPQNLSASVIGAAVVLRWEQPQRSTSGPASEMIIEAGSAAGISDLATVRGTFRGIFFAQSLPAGTYFVRVRAANAGGLSAPSNEVQVVVP